MSKRKASSTSLSTLRSDPRSPHHANMTQIDPNGNLCMTFPSSTNAPSQSLLVSHHILCLSSKVFKEMLNPYTPWRAKSQPRCIPDPIDTVEFPDDDYASMLIVMNVLHMQHQRVPLKVDIEQLYKLAMLCDKYDLVQSMGLWPEKWTQRFAANVETVGYHGLLLIAHVFRHEEIFAQISRYLILNSKIDLDTGELVTVKGVPFTEGVPDAIIEKIKTSRANTILTLLSTLHTRYDRLRYSHSSSRVCQYHSDQGSHADFARSQCDAWNLGCLVQKFPDLPRRWDSGVEEGRVRTWTVMGVKKTIDDMHRAMREGEYVIGAHVVRTGCGSVERVVRRVLEDVEGLRLGD